jgi:UPF0755 protein
MSRAYRSGRLMIVLAFLLLAGVVALLALSRILYSPYKGFEGPETFVEIPRGSSVPEIGSLLERSGVIRSSTLFTWYVRFRPGASLKAGEYRFDRPSSMTEVADKLLRGEVYVTRVTIPEGYSRTDIIDYLVAQGISSREDLDQATRNTRPISDLDTDSNDLEGYLFPETYFFSRRATADEVVGAMVSNFRRVWTTERQARAAELRMGLREVVTLASIIEKETGVADERPLVAAVFHNRLRDNIRLGSDPTVIYAAKLENRWDGIIHQSDLRAESPYNTYLVYGLPPGPIASPGLASIDAALQPAEVDYLYFVSRNDGTHLFSVNYADHVRAVNKYQR